MQQLVLPVPGLGIEPLSRASRPRVAPSRVAAQVHAFHRAFGLPRANTPSVESVTDEVLRLRERLLDEETAEFAVASHRRDLVGMADALADIVYVAYGTAVTLGLDLDLILDEVHRSNLSKLDERGRPVLRHDGKVLKSPRYSPPDIAAVIAEQPTLPFGPAANESLS
ncbi:nucleotide pyrophosphohydrolase [Terrabacter sp. MAHUQ-38]|uniref:nucleotide pyrophosphohydrolase n=1 Tax=unclassified Terrabacter TaxID=2630222 RepID=UPI00165E270F|nr:nucleotide pyrophosphohydrolase [Terrabacter sp. MAHUQ-38]MBC9820100.1 nucleotide pyrophosphohydrolase [Terrabacter sp. MAHUQ-38]